MIDIIISSLQIPAMLLTLVGGFYTSDSTHRKRYIGFICSCIACSLWISWAFLISTTTSIWAIVGIVGTNMVMFVWSLRGISNNANKKIEVL